MAAPPQAPPQFRIVIDCRLRQFVIGFAPEALLLLDGAQALPLVPAAADQGQRFEAAGDPSTFVQTEGSRATVALRGVLYASCSLSR
jgi:hypothetical protein